MRRFRFTLVGIGVAAALVVWNQLQAEEAPRTSDALQTPAIGSPAPGFEALDEQGNRHTLAQYRGKGVVLEWTNQDCPYVQRHYGADTMEKLAKQLGGDGVVWLAVNSTHDNTPEATRSWRDAQGFEYATLQDADGTLGRSYGARTTPHMFVIDAQGVLRYAGAIDDDPRGRSSSPHNYVASAVHAVQSGNDPDPQSTRAYGCSVKYGN